MYTHFRNYFLLVNAILLTISTVNGKEYISGVGDPGMRRDGLRVAFEAWNFCNEVGHQAPSMASPRAADCFDLAGKHLRQSTEQSTNFISGFPFCFFPHLFISFFNWGFYFLVLLQMGFYLSFVR